MTKEKRNRPTTGDSPLKMGSLWIQAYRLNPSKPSSQESRGFNHGSVNFDQITAAELDRQSGVTVSRKGKPRASTKPGDGWGMTHTGAEYDDMGGASRFYPVFRHCSKASPSERPKVDGILHPTVKPVELMRWLVRLITPEGGLVLEPFAGSGTTLEACLLEHMQCMASELDPDYIKLIHARLSKPIQNELF